MLEELWAAGRKIWDFLVALWNLLVEWVQDFMLDWTTKYEPAISSLVKEALVVLDKVEVRIKRAAKAAWKELRKYLLKQTIDIFELKEGHWTYRIATWLLLSKEKVVRKVVEDRYASYDELPDDVRAELIRRGEIDEIDFTKTRDGEFEKVTA